MHSLILVLCVSSADHSTCAEHLQPAASPPGAGRGLARRRARPVVLLFCRKAARTWCGAAGGGVNRGCPRGRGQSLRVAIPMHRGRSGQTARALHALVASLGRARGRNSAAVGDRV